MWWFLSYHSQANVEDVLRAASFFQIYSLRNACCKYLTQLVDSDNAIGIYNFAEQFSCTQLQEAAFRLGLLHFSEDVRSQMVKKFQRHKIWKNNH